jgi:beta-lactamase regulating signal transducer with metallopeptidase domain/DNA gyrase inhibitor GyrI
VAATINDIARLWWGWMAPMLWQASLLIVLIGLIDRAVRGWAWPQFRYALWLLVLVKLLVPPTWSSPVGVISRIEPSIRRSVILHWGGPMRSGESPSPTRSAASPPGRESASGLPRTGAPAENLLPPGRAVGGARTSCLSAQGWALLAWIAGMLAFASLLTLKMIRLRRWHRRQRDKKIPEWFHRLLVEIAGTLRLSRIPAIVFSKDAVTPAVYGMFRPVLLLPAGYLNRLSREEAEHVLLHELSHLKRGDLWMHGLYLILHVVYWFNPLLIWTRREMKHVREICCDLSVAAVLREKTRRYRLTLLNTARELLTENVEPGLGLLGVFEEPFKLVTRLKWLEKEPWKHRKWIPALSLCAGLSVAAVIIPMSGPDAPPFRDDLSLLPGSSGTASFVDDRAAGKTGEGRDFDIVLKRTRPMTAVILPRIGPPGPRFESAMAELKALMKDQGLKSKGDLFFRMWTDLEKVPESLAAWEVGCPVRPDASAKPPLEIIRLPEFQVASADLHGLFASTRTWKNFAERVSAMGLVPAFPPAVEVYRTREDSKPIWWSTEMQMQSFRPEAGYPGLDIRLRETGPGMAVVLPIQGSYAKHSEAVDRLRKYIRKNNIQTLKRWFCIYYSDPSKVTPAEYFWDVGCVLDPDRAPGLRVDPPFELRRLERDSVAFTAFGCPPDAEFPFMPFFFQSLMKGYMPNGFIGQTWSEDPYRDDRDVRRTEFFLPAKTVAGFAGKMEESGRAAAEWSSPYSVGSVRRNASMNEDSVETEEAGPHVSADRRSSPKTGWRQKLSDFFGLHSGSGEKKSLFRMERSNPGWVVLLPSEGSMDQQSVIFDKLWNYLTANGIETTGPPFTFQYTDDAVVQKFELRWDAGYPVRDSAAVKPPFRSVRIPARDVVKIHYVKGMNDKSLSVQLAAWMYHNDYRNRMPNMLIWTDGIQHPGREINRVDVEVQIEKMPEPYPEIRLFTRSEDECRELILPMTGTLKQEDEALRKLRQFAEKNGIEARGDYFLQYHNSLELTPEKDLTWDVGVPVKGDVPVSDPYRTEWRHGRKWVCVYFEGDPRKIPEPFWISYTLNFVMNGYTVNGYPRKVLREKLAENKWKVELQWAVKE